MRTLTGPAAAVLGHRLALVQLVQLDLTLPVRVASCRDDIVWSGNTYLGGKQIAAEGIKDQGGEVVGLSFQLSGVPTDLLTIALSEPIQGKTVTVWTALLDADTLAILDVLQAWKGTLDVMPISVGMPTSSITVTAEHRGLTFARPKGLKYTSGDQTALYPGDLSLEYIVAQSTHQDVWPAAAFFRQ